MASTAFASLGWIALPGLASAQLDTIAPGDVLGDAPADAVTDAAMDPMVARAHAALARLSQEIANQDLVAVADFSKPSSVPRFHLIDMQAGRIDQSFLVAHGRGSDPRHRGKVQRFSNEIGSNASSEGAYRTGDRYVGKHGRSIRLGGLDPSNSNAEARAIVIHSAPYVSPTVLQTQGKLGLSEGCFVFSEGDYEVIFQRLGPDQLLMAGFF